MGIYISIYSIKHTGTEKYAKQFFDLMNKYGLNIDKIGLFEPVRKPFTIEDSIDMWTNEEPGIYNLETNKMIGKSGGMLGKGKGYWFQTHWWLHPTELSLTGQDSSRREWVVHLSFRSLLTEIASQQKKNRRVY